MAFFHGGIAGLVAGGRLVPSDPHVEDGCPICEARASGRTATVGEYRQWLHHQGPRAIPVLKMLADAPDSAPMDPPSSKRAVYISTDLAYARWYAARSRGDLYEVRPLDVPARSGEDPFPTWTVAEAEVVRVIERGVVLRRQDRRELSRRWRKADRARGNEKPPAEVGQRG
jgi:hypothetical protein